MEKRRHGEERNEMRGRGVPREEEIIGIDGNIHYHRQMQLNPR
jgi:hypothetical protein